jgi:hypothetical protein
VSSTAGSRQAALLARNLNRGYSAAAVLGQRADGGIDLSVNLSTKYRFCYKGVDGMEIVIPSFR